MSGIEKNAVQNNAEIGTVNDSETTEASLVELEKNEEAKLKAKFTLAGRPASSIFLQKRLAHRQKYFDSGDYQMAKQKSAVKSRQIPVGLTYETGEAIPTPETVPVRKASIIQPCRFTSSKT